MSSSADSIVGIVVALPEELCTLTTMKLKQGECTQLGNVLIVRSGTGMVNAAKAAQTLIEKGAKQLVSWGCAAGLVKDVKPGDILLAEKVVSEQDQFDTDAQWRRRVLRTLNSVVPVHSGKLFTSNKLVSHSLDKQQIQQHSQAYALDMESAAIADVARKGNLPFLAIRSIADPVNMDLPAAVLASLNGEGQVKLSKLLRHLLFHPWEILGLIKLGLHFHAAQKTLKTVARQLKINDNHPVPIAN